MWTLPAPLNPPITAGRLGHRTHHHKAVLTGGRLYSGDTGPSKALEQLAQGCDLLIHMCSYITGSVAERATQIGTSGHIEAARAAAAAGAKRLVATHIYDQFDRPGVREKVVAEMARVYDGVIVIGEDLMELSLTADVPGVFR